MMVQRLSGKTALVTGAGSIKGIGYAIARRFVYEGAAVLMTDIRSDELSVANEAMSSITTASMVCPMDVTDPSDWSQAIEMALAHWGKVDILVNNAGIFYAQTIAETSIDAFDALVSVNVRGSFLGCRAIIPHLRQRGGSIINMSSIGALIGIPNSAAYATTKGAVRSLTKTIAVEEAKNNIRCNSIHPGSIDTGFVEGAVARDDAAKSKIAATVPLGRLGTSDDVAGVALFLASDDASYVTGAELVVDGGLAVA